MTQAKEFRILLATNGWNLTIVEAPAKEGQKTIVVNGRRMKILQDQGRLEDRVIFDGKCAANRKVGSCKACCRYQDCLYCAGQ